MVLSSINKGLMVVVTIGLVVVVVVVDAVDAVDVAAVVVAVVSPGPLEEENPKSRSPAWKNPRLLMKKMV